MSRWSKLMGDGNRSTAKALSALVPDVNEWEAELEQLSDDELRARTDEFRDRLEAGETPDDVLVEAFAVVREASKRVLGLRHFDVQIMAGAALHFGHVAEMGTGEGKTLVATLPVYVNALEGRGVHVVTVNDYLAARDAETLRPLYEFLGLTVGVVTEANAGQSELRREQYLCDVTYGTNHELGFDYLRDNMAFSPRQMVQRGHHFAIVDEADSVLIDEARTPLIVTEQTDPNPYRFAEFTALAEKLAPEVHYEVDEVDRVVRITPAGIEVVEAELGLDNLYDAHNAEAADHLGLALQAKGLYVRDRDYVVEDGRVLIVDEFTGRTLADRSWSDGLHQAVESKEGVPLTAQNRTMATVTLQSYFRLYEKLAGMTGTAMTSADELAHIYHLTVVEVPPNKKRIREDGEDIVFQLSSSKLAAARDDVKARAEAGQPVLVGTASVEASEQFSKLLDEAGVDHEVLNARRHAKEAVVIAQAGRPGAVTVATNMAGRGVDILLGGNAELLAEAALAEEFADTGSEAAVARLAELRSEFAERCAADADKVRAAGGLAVIGIERHASRRIDDQLRGRAGRQGDPGYSRFYLALDDPLLSNFATDSVARLMGSGWDEAPLRSKMVTKMIAKAQAAIEGRDEGIRKQLVAYDEVYDVQRRAVYGLRHDVMESDDLVELLDGGFTALASAMLEPCRTSADPELVAVEAVRQVWAQAAPQSELPTVLEGDDESAVLEHSEATGLVGDALFNAFDELSAELGEAGVNMDEAVRTTVLLATDRLWRKQLSDLEHMRGSVMLRAAAQINPVVEWRKEATGLFEEMMFNIRSQFAQALLTLESEPDGDAGNSEADDAPGNEEPTVEDGTDG